MSNRLFTELSVLLTRDKAQRQKLFDITQVIDELDEITGNATEMVSRHFILAPSASDEEATMDKITSASTVLIIAEQDITVKFNGVGSPAVPVRAIPADTIGNTTSLYQKAIQPGLVFWRGKVDSIHLGNPSTTDTATVTVVMIGDAT